MQCILQHNDIHHQVHHHSGEPVLWGLLSSQRGSTEALIGWRDSHVQDGGLNPACLDPCKRHQRVFDMHCIFLCNRLIIVSPSRVRQTRTERLEGGWQASSSSTATVLSSGHDAIIAVVDAHPLRCPISRPEGLDSIASVWGSSPKDSYNAMWPASNQVLVSNASYIVSKVFRRVGTPETCQMSQKPTPTTTHHHHRPHPLASRLGAEATFFAASAFTQTSLPRHRRSKIIWVARCQFF